MVDKLIVTYLNTAFPLFKQVKEKIRINVQLQRLWKPEIHRYYTV